VDILLVAPNGANAIIMSHVGGGLTSVSGTLALDDAAAAPLPASGPLTPGTFRPTNLGSGDPFPAPAPIPSGGSALSVFNGSNPNGTWRLFVVDDDGTFIPIGGSIQGGWTLILQGPSATTVSAAPNPAPFGQAVTLTATVTGQGTPTGTVTFRDGAA